MTDNFLTVAQQVAILFVLIGTGAALRKLKVIPEHAIQGLVNLLILVVTPCLIVDVFQRPFDPAMLRGLFLTFAVAVFAHLAVIAVATLAVRHADEDVVRPLRMAAVFSNAGFMGIPLEQALLGDRGVFYGAVYIVVFNLFMWSWGVGRMKNEELRVKSHAEGGRILNSSFLNLHSIVNPGTVGIACGLPLFFFSVRLPAVVGVPVHEIAALNTPVAMIIIGYCLVGAKLGRVARMPCVYVATALRLLVCPLLMIAVLHPFRHLLDRNMTLAVVIAASAPVAAMVSMFAAKFGRDVDVSVAVVSGSTLLSVLTMPIIIAFAMNVL